MHERVASTIDQGNSATDPRHKAAREARRLDIRRAGTASIFMFRGRWPIVARRRRGPKTQVDWALEVACLLE